MLKGLKRLAAGGWMLRAGLRELRGLRLATERVADAMEFANQQVYPARLVTQPDARPAVEVSYVNDQEQAARMQIELDLTAARGMAPSEDEVQMEFERRYTQGAGQ